MEKKVLTEQALYHGNVDMPEGYEINSLELSKTTLEAIYTHKEFMFSKTWDKLNTFFIENFRLKYELNLVNKKTWGDVYEPQKLTLPLINVDPLDLRNSPDFTLLYGVKVKDCFVRIHYEDNRRKGRSWDIELKDNKFIMFPSTNMYYITNNQPDSLNYIQTITYEYI